ncbi:hypothetical protein HD806DRAFT_511051 [Xylariaceae sp. AK1471]|nr:hypothetical protein HD806DRAFT_511051 [Xylariaceae sp. AK1471]
MALPMTYGVYDPSPFACSSASLAKAIKHKQQIEQGHDSKSRRSYRNALLRFNNLQRSRAPEVAEHFVKNPESHGLPKGFKIQLKDTNSGSTNVADENQAISAVKSKLPNLVVGAFGTNDGDIKLGNITVPSDKVNYSAATKTLSWDAMVPNSVSLEPQHVAGMMDFAIEPPQGTVMMNGASAEAILQKDIINYKMKVSANAGADYNTAAAALTWDPDSTAWKSATWEEGDATFGLDTFTENNLVTGKITYYESYITDLSDGADHPVEMALTKDLFDNSYTTVTQVDPTGNVLMVINVTDPSIIPPAPESRKGKAVPSIFPQEINLRFTTTAEEFTGAYTVLDPATQKRSTYAVWGQYFKPGMPEISMAPESTDIPAMPPLQQSTLNVFGFMNCDVMVPDTGPNAVGGFKDIVSESAQQDFYDIILYYMDDDLRKLFISATPVTLSDEVKAIADDDQKNKEFYQKLQVPYLTMLLGRSKVDQGKHCNTIRAQKMLKEIPSNDPTYKRHSTKLYELHFLRKFPTVSVYLEDQKQDKSRQIDAIAITMKNETKAIAEPSKAVSSDPDANLQQAFLEIDALATRAKTDGTYWAFAAYYYLWSVTLKSWNNLYTSGNTSSTIALKIRNINTIFGILDKADSTETSKSYMVAWNELLRTSNMTSLVPQCVDLQGNFEDFDSIFKACLEQYYKRFADNPNTDVTENVNTAQKLYSDNQLRRSLLADMQKIRFYGDVIGADFAWEQITKNWGNLLQKNGFLTVTKTLSRVTAFIGTAFMASALMMVMFNGGWKELNIFQKVMYGGTAALIAAQSLVQLYSAVTTLAKGAFRLYAFWNHFQGWGNGFRILFGSEVPLQGIGHAANRIQTTCLKNFAMTAEQKTALVAEGAAAPPGRWAKFRAAVFGPNLMKMYMSAICVGFAIYGMILAAQGLASATDSALKWANAFSLASACVQLLGMAMGWIAGLEALQAAGAGTRLFMLARVASFCASWAGPLAFGLAVVGLIILLVWWKNQPDPVDPVDSFVNDKVKPAGLYMEHTAIDYIDMVPPKNSTDPPLAGVSISPKLPNEFYVQIKGGSKDFGYDKTVDIQTATNMNYQTNTVWMLDTDSSGQSIISTMVTTSDGSPVVYYLGIDGANAIKAIPRPVKPQPPTAAPKTGYANLSPLLPDTPQTVMTQDEYNKALTDYVNNMKMLQWTIETVADPTWQTIPEVKASASVPAQPEVKSVLSVEAKMTNIGTSKNLSFDSKGSLSLSGDLSLMFKMQPLAPSSFSYDTTTFGGWLLHVSDTGAATLPLWDLGSPLPGSVDWQISPALPNAFELVTSASGGATEGTVRMRSGAHLKDTDVGVIEYTVTCKLKGTSADGTKTQAKVTIKIEKDPEVAQA